MKKPFKRLYTEANRQIPLPDGLAEKAVGAMKKEAASSPESAAGPARRKRPSRIAVPAVVTAAALCLAFLLFPGPAGLPAGNLSSDASGSGEPTGERTATQTAATAGTTPSTRPISGQGTKTVMLAQPSLPADSQNRRNPHLWCKHCGSSPFAQRLPS